MKGKVVMLNGILSEKWVMYRRSAWQCSCDLGKIVIVVMYGKLLQIRVTLILLIFDHIITLVVHCLIMYVKWYIMDLKCIIFRHGRRQGVASRAAVKKLILKLMKIIIYTYFFN